MSVYLILSEDALGFLSRPRRDPDALARLRDRRLQSIVRYATRAVPYYRRLFEEAGITPERIRGIQDLPLIPSVSKDELRAVPLAERVAEGFDPGALVRQMTSGSTGEPMPILRTRTEESLVHAYQLRSQLACGVPLRARRAKVGKSYKAGLLHKLGLLPTFELSPLEKTPAEILERLRQWRAECLDLRPGVLEPLVEEATRQGREDWPWLWMVSGGEVLYPDLKSRAEAVFGARILERYGAHEFGQVAWGCPECGRMHTNDDSVVVEILRDGRPARPGERGHVHVTGLLSYAMPFLRFPLGDLAVQGPEAGSSGCSFGFGTIETVEGRELDNLTLADGRSFPTYGLMAELRQVPGVRRFQVVQESIEDIRVRYVAEGDADPGSELARRLRNALPVEARVRTESLTEIAPEESGKYRYIRSLTASAGRRAD